MKKFFPIILIVFLLLFASCSNKTSWSGYDFNILTTPKAPTNVRLSTDENNNLKITWTDNSNNETGFKIQRQVEQKTFQDIATVDKNTTQYIDKSNLGGKITYRVCAYNSKGNSKWVETNALTGEKFNFAYKDNEYNLNSTSIIASSDGGYIGFGSIVDTNLNYYGWIAKINNKGELIFNKTYAYNNNLRNYIKKIIQTPDGNYIVAGNTRDIITYNYYAWIFKIDNNGNIINNINKTFFYTENNDNVIFDIISTTDGGYIAVGNTYDGSRRYGWILKIDNNANQIYNYAYNFNGDNYDSLYNIISTSDGEYIAFGYSQYNGNNYGWILKINNNGEESFNQIYSYNFNPRNDIERIIETSNNNYIVVGKTRDSDNNFSGWIVKINNNGELQFNNAYKYQDNNYNMLNSIIANSNGNFIAVGYIVDTDNKHYGWILKIDNNGNQIFNKTYTNENNLPYSDLNTIIKTPNGNYIVLGNSYDEGETELYGYGWIIKIDNNGNILNNFNKIYSYKNNNYNQISNIIKTSDGTFLAGGLTNSDENNLFWIFKIDNNGNYTYVYK